ncbi:MAG: HlyD family efflux transporter periplasmic adaptor subunit [Pseudohongiellaceae bacterium]
MQKIISPATARVEQIHVAPGDQVHKGDVLASLAKDIHNEAGYSIYRENIDQLTLDRELLEKQLYNQQQAALQSVQWSRIAKENLHSDKLNLKKEAELLGLQLQLSDRNLQAVAKLLEAGNSSTREFDQQYRGHLELLGRKQALSQREMQIEHELDALDNRQQRAEFESQQSRLTLQRELQSIDQKIRTLDNQALFTVVAEGPGVVAELGLEAGKPVLVNQPLFYINPSSTELQATIFVPAAVQGKLVVGQSVLLRYDAFDFRLYGRQEATVIAIGQARLDPRETLLAVAGISEPVFKIVAEISSPTVSGSSTYHLQSGSTLIADFVVAEMSLLQFIFKPVLGLRGKVT